jgi:hypothetical protein
MYVDSERVQNGDTKKLELDSNSTNTDLEICRMDSNEDSTNSQISKKINKIPKTVSSTP